MLEKSMYDSWVSRIHLFIKGKKNGRIMLDSIHNGPPVYQTFEENRQTRPKKYSELTEAQQLQMTVIYPDPLALVANFQTLYNPSQSPQHSVTLQSQAEFPQLESGLVVPMFQQGDDPIKCINKAMAFLFVMAQGFHLQIINSERLPIPEIRQPFKMEESPFNKFKEDKLRVLLALGNEELLQPQGETMQLKLMLVEAQEAGHILDEEQLAFIADPGIAEVQVAQQTIAQNSIFQTEELDAYDSDCDDISSAKAVLMEKLSSYDPDVLSKVPYSDSYLNDMINQNVQEMSYSEQTHVDDYPDNEINSDSNIFPYSQYLQESQDAGIQDTNSLEPNDLLVLSLVEQMTDHVANLDKENQTNKMVIKIRSILKKLSEIKPTSYDGSVIVKEHAVISLIDDEETLILEEASLSKMLDKQNDLISLKQKINISPIDYSKLNKIKEDFDKHFVTQKELSVEQVFWLKHSNYNPDSSVKSHTPFRIEAPSELPRVNLLSIDNDQLRKQIMSQEIVHIAVNSVDILDVKKSCVNECNKCLELETGLLKKKAQSQEKDTVIRKLKDRIKSLSEKDNVGNVKKDIDKIETIHIELEHTLKNELRKLKGKNVIDTAVSKPSATIAPGIFKLDIEPISHRLKNNRDAHEVYLEKAIENTDILHGLVECDRKQNPSEPLLEFACMFTKYVQELITSTKVVPTKETSIKSVATATQGILVYSRRPKATRSVGSSSKVKMVFQIVLWYLDSRCSKHMAGNHSQLINFISKFLGTVRFGNDHIPKIMGYGDYQMGNVTISRVYYVEGLGQNLFFVGQFCDFDLEVAFRKHTYFIRELDGVDLLKGSRGSNLYTLSMDNLFLSSPICLFSKASKSKSWLWHRRLSHLNFDYITSLAKHGLVRGLPKLKYQKDHLCSACALGKSKKHSHKPKAEDSIQEKLYLLHMDLCGPMRVQSINGRKYILVIVDDFSRFTWVKFLRSKDEVPEFVIKFLKMIQVRLNATVRNIRTDNGTEFVNQTLKAYYEEVRISHQTSVARTPQQNGIVERRNRTLVEAARTMLIFSKALLFLWAKAAIHKTDH
ncbi:retrovirus-related pol polyprotein from transposon TNT 1-94 [Tanacetum coccineum]